MPDLIKVGMADYKVGAAPSTLISYGLGSCIGLSLYDPKAKVGGLLHYMLPDSKQARASDTPAKFAEDTGLNYGRTVAIDLNDGTYTVKTVSKGDKTI